MDKTVPKHIRLKQEIKSWIDNGTLRSGDLLPSENDIAQRFQMSRQTVRQALGALEQEGLLSRQQGKGTYVSESFTPAQTAEAEFTEPKTIGVLTTYISDYIFPHIVRGIESELRRHGYRLVLSSTDNDKERERESLEMLLREPLSGLIVEPTRSALGNPNFSYYASLDYKGIPYLMINETYPELNCPYVKLDDELGGYLAAEHLLRLGHRSVAGFFKTDDMQGVQRLKGFLRAHHELGVPLRPELIVQYKTEDKQHTPHQAALRLLAESEQRPTAFVCYNDELAVRLLDAARSQGLSVPGQLSLVGFDDSPLATATEVKLTTLVHPKTVMGEASARLLIQMIERRRTTGTSREAEGGEDATVEPIVYKPELVVRESSAPPAGQT
ncbi:GntR family transcriptional regulator [Paenibacillus chartarius]|uniref:GntR family transcriptional regulator n=1 Tax=Paenibacillus chartarius TaxID=747481 RepID=A0ABV6DPQ0_9BACL